MNHIRNLKKVLCSLCIVVLFSVAITQQAFGQQRAHFTQYITNELVINPAYAGAEEALSVALLHRGQWSDIEGAPTTQSFTAHSLFKSKNVGLGLSIVNDKIGIHGILTAHSSYAYHLQLNKETFLSFGLQFGLNQRKSDFSSLSNQIQNNNDPKLSSSNISKTSFEFGSGLYLKSPKLSLGFSIPNMLPEKTPSDSINFGLINNNIYFVGRYKIPVSNNVSFQPGILVKYVKGLPVSYDINFAAILNDVLLLGLSYRAQKSINAIIQAKLTPQLKIGYAFDYPLGKVSTVASNSNEFMISYLFRFSRSRISKPRE